MFKTKNELYMQAMILSDLRYQLGITIKDLAQEMGYSCAYVANWCCGVRACDIDKVKAAMRRIVVRRYEEVMKWE